MKCIGKKCHYWDNEYDICAEFFEYEGDECDLSESIERLEIVLHDYKLALEQNKNIE